MAKIIDFLEKFVFKGIDGKSSFSKSAQKDAQAAIVPKIERLEDLKKSIKDIGEILNNFPTELAKLNNNKASKNEIDKFAQQTQRKRKLLENLQDEEDNLLLALNSSIEKIAKRHKLTAEQVHKLKDVVSDESFSLDKETLSFNSSMKKIHSAAQGGFSSLIADMGSFFKEFVIVGELINISFHQVQELNKQVVEFNRSMGQGQLSSKMIGADMYGNTAVGSLSSIALMNAISEKEFFAAFSAFGKGKALGGNENFFSQQENMRQFGIGAAQLSKFYGIEMGTINTITSNLVYNFGTKVKDLNDIFIDGKSQVIAAGLSVKEYFNNLKEASDQVGRYYIAGGIQGLQKLAFYATATGQTVSQVLANSERFKNFTSQYELQNNASAMGFGITSKNIMSAWSKDYTGHHDEAQKIFLTSLAKDIKRSGLVDPEGEINPQGLRNLQDFGINPEEVATIQKWITKVDKSGISIDAWNDKMNQSTELQAKMYEFEHKNMQFGERIGEIWGRIKNTIIDPIASIVGPLISDVIGVVKIVVDIFGPIIKNLLWPLTMLGKAFEWAGGIIDKWGAASDKFSKEIDDWFGSVGLTGKAFGALVGILEAVGIALIAFEANLMLSNKLSSIANAFGMGGKIAEGAEGAAMGGNFFKRAFSRGGRLLGMGKTMDPEALAAVEEAAPLGTWFGGATGMMAAKGLGMGVIKGVGYGAIADVAGQAIGHVTGHENAGAIAGKTLGGGILGAEIGSAILPGIGTAVGAIIGAGAGVWMSVNDIAAKRNESWWDALGEWWNDKKEDEDKQTKALGATAETHNLVNHSDMIKAFVGKVQTTPVAKYSENNSQQMHPQGQITNVYVQPLMSKTVVDMRKSGG